MVDPSRRSAGPVPAVDTLSTVNEATPEEQAGPPALAPDGLERLDALEDQVLQLTTRLAGWVEGQLAQAVDDRRSDLRALRTELLQTVDVRVKQMPAPASVDAGEVGARIEAFEQRMKAAMGRLTDSMEARLADANAARASELDALRSSLGDRLDRRERDASAAAERTAALEQKGSAAIARLEKAVDTRLQAIAAQVTAASDGVSALQAEAGAGPARAELLEQRVRSAMGRLAESVEARLAEAVAARPGELVALRTELERAVAQQVGELRTEIETVGAASRARAAQAQERLDAVEARQGDAGALETLRRQLDEALAQQVREARTEIATSVADAHRRFVVAVDSLDERMAAVTEQVAASKAVVGGVEALPDAVASDGRRIEALEEHTRRTDAHLSDLVDAKLAELSAERLAELAAARSQLRESVDAHLADVRAEVAFGTSRLEEALAAVATLGASVERSQREADARLADAVQVKLDELEKAAADLAVARVEVAEAVTAFDRRVADAEDQVRRQVEELAVQVAGLVKTATTEGGVLAPLRSDIRHLQAQLAELAETVEAIRPRRKAPAPAPAVRRRAPAAPVPMSAAKKAPAAPVKKAPAAKKGAAKKAVAAKAAPRRRGA